MGLGITIGILADLAESEPEGAAWVRQNLQATADVMPRAGLAPHKEPEATEAWSASGYGYSGPHALREVAGLVWQGEPIRSRWTPGSPASGFRRPRPCSMRPWQPMNPADRKAF